MDSGQRHRFIQQLLKLTSDPERRSVARDLFCDHNALRPSITAELTPPKKLSTFWGSTPVWGAMGVLIGAIGSQISLKFLLMAVWGTLWVEFVRVGFFPSRLMRRIGNTAVGVVLAILLIRAWPYVKPKEPATLDQQADVVIEKIAKKFPLLANPPKQVEVKSAPTIVVSSLPKLKISLTSGKREDRTLNFDNSKGDSKLRDFVITGLEYYLDMQGVANQHANIVQRNVLPGPLNFKRFDIDKGMTKQFNLNEEVRSAVAIHMHDVPDNEGRPFDDMRHYICLQILFTQDDTAETFVHYEVMSPYGDLFQLAEHPENAGSGPAGEEGWPYSIVRVIKENARRYYGAEYREYQP